MREALDANSVVQIADPAATTDTSNMRAPTSRHTKNVRIVFQADHTFVSLSQDPINE